MGKAIGVGIVAVTIVGAIGDDSVIATLPLDVLPGVDKVLPILKPYKLVSRQLHPEDTVIEVNGRDRPGLLHDITAAISSEGLQIASAHVSTYGVRAVDVGNPMLSMHSAREMCGTQDQARMAAAMGRFYTRG